MSTGLTLFVLLLGGVLLLMLLRRFGPGFHTQRPQDYAGSAPQFVLQRHLGGAMVSQGVIFGPGGRVVSRFSARMQGDWDAPPHGAGPARGTLQEVFTYGDGSTQNRCWQIEPRDATRFRATAEDIIGEAEGEICGASARLRYRIRLAPEAGGHLLDVVDWMYLAPDGTIVNRSQMRKFGIKVAELIATVSRDPANAACPPAPRPASAEPSAGT